MLFIDLFVHNVTWVSVFLLPSKSYSDVRMCELQLRNTGLPLPIPKPVYSIYILGDALFLKMKFYFGAVPTGLEPKQQNIFLDSWM